MSTLIPRLPVPPVRRLGVLALALCWALAESFALWRSRRRAAR
jgi:hypothetical protein